MNNDLQTLIAGLTAVVEGDRWLSADACWVFIGARSKRVFLERIACRPDFPKPARPADAETRGSVPKLTRGWIGSGSAEPRSGFRS